MTQTGLPDITIADPIPDRRQRSASPFVRWLMRERITSITGPEVSEEHHEENAWWKVMCLTGVDYFSSLGYTPGIAALAAGAISPLATLLIVFLTLLGMLPMYRRVAQESPHGQGSVAMLERLLPFWRGKLLVLVLLGFVVTSWIITITLSAADATAHLIENPFTPKAFDGHAVVITVILLLILGGVFLAGFSEAVIVAVPLVVAYLGLNLVVVIAGVVSCIGQPVRMHDWFTTMLATGGAGNALVTAFIAFPLLVLGLSGFETGVSMMPLIKADGKTDKERLKSRIARTRKLLASAAIIMSAYLLATSFITTVLIPAPEFAAGGQANGRALAYLAHGLLGNGFGTAYDISTILILWFAGASAMAGLINIVPRYLPSYGMAPEWGRALRPVVLLNTAIAIAITIWFGADVDSQAGAYATGILVMMMSGAFAVTLAMRRYHRTGAAIGFGLVTALLAYAVAVNIIDKPDGIVISVLFIVAMAVVSLASRISRSTELRHERIEFDDLALAFIADGITAGSLHFIAHRYHCDETAEELKEKEHQQRLLNPIPPEAHVIVVEVEVTDPSEFSSTLIVHGIETAGHHLLRLESAAAPNALAALMLRVRDHTGLLPHLHFQWTEGNPLAHLARFVLLGQGETAPVTREVLRQAEPNVKRRPIVHVGG